MTMGPKSTRSNVIPTMRYRDALKAIDWLCNAFGFERHAVYEGEEGIVEHAQLTFGNGMIMLGSVGDSDFNRNTVQPDEIGGRETQSAYVIVADADEHYAKAKAAGAEIVLDIKSEDYGGRGYTCRDLEGHIWTFGTYDPWEKS